MRMLFIQLLSEWMTLRVSVPELTQYRDLDDGKHRDLDPAATQNKALGHSPNWLSSRTERWPVSVFSGIIPVRPKLSMWINST